MSGLVHGDLNELFSEFSFVGNIGRKGNDNVTFKQSVFKRLFNSKKIESLTLHSTNVITKDIPSRQVSSLTNLKLINVSVSMENLRIICNRLESLTELTLIGNDIDQRAGLILANSKLKNLTHLTIGNKIGSEGAEHLLTTNKLKRLKKLEFTDPIGTTFQTDGFIEYVPLIDCSKFPDLCSFTSCRHLLSKEGIMNVLNSGISWKELTFIGCRSFDDDCILRIGKITSIEKLCLEDYCGIPYIGFSISYEYLSSLQNLTHLEISVDNNGLLELCKIEPNNLKYFCNYVHFYH
ncbi:hypothetical protein C9374_001412 [Naegleria lovaniensis]|uniref:Uncharacterized protein n=1 Tax=Naegleria lovaniensis TaxID=51637 RepID=A0AA88KMQ5_NAELO|nr:uncharacterized protein C9374_001412 [Naegleria lovaniensis]KAG2387818.1 hypothetical protein C9374_001412 [Naegleria lovaniensis]